MVKAFYSSTPKLINGKIKTIKYMVIQNYNKISLVDLLDNLDQVVFCFLELYPQTY